MYFLYSLLLTAGFILMLPRFAIDALRSRKYITGLSQRLGNIPLPKDPDRQTIWLHCVSVGETEAARPLVRALRESFPSYQLVVSTTTVTGQQVARRLFDRDAAAIFYFPIDWAWTVRRVLRALKPRAILIMETELWPNLLRESKRRAIPVALVNGRISGSSFGRYQRIRPFMPRVLNDLSVASMQSQQDADRIRELGISNDRLLTNGNLKFDSAIDRTSNGLTSIIRDRFNFKSDERLIVAASTHAPEEDVVIRAFRQVQESKDARRVRLLIAPRHPERFNEVAALLETSGLNWTRRSNAPSETDRACDLVLLDSIGELRAALPLADLAFIGGSISRNGGHNVLEPAAHGVCVVTGAHTENFDEITNALLADEAIVQLRDVAIADAPAELASIIDGLLRDEDRRRTIGQRALAVCTRNQGATERTIKIVADLLNSRAAATDTVPFPSVHLSAAK